MDRTQPRRERERGGRTDGRNSDERSFTRTTDGTRGDPHLPDSRGVPMPQRSCNSCTGRGVTPGVPPTSCSPPILHFAQTESLRPRSRVPRRRGVHLEVRPATLLGIPVHDRGLDPLDAQPSHGRTDTCSFGTSGLPVSCVTSGSSDSFHLGCFGCRHSPNLGPVVQ